MRSSFLIIRFVFFALLVNLNLLVLVFAAWNANSSVGLGLSVSATTVFLFLNSCAMFFFVTLGLAELVVPHAKTSRLLFECIWSAVLGIFQIGTAISITVHGPIVCRQTSNWDLCASSSLLVPTTWLSSILILTHFFVLFITTMAHVRLHSSIWSESIYTVNWFNYQDMNLFLEKGGKMSEPDANSWPKHIDDIEALQKHASLFEDCEKAPWAQTTNIRRGVDAPFRKDSPRTTPSTTPHNSLPVAPLRVQERSTVGSRFIEKFRESKVLSRSETPLQYGSYYASRLDPFPPKVDNHDLPIPLPRLSEWIRADAIKGINVHTVPHSP